MRENDHSRLLIVYFVIFLSLVSCVSKENKQTPFSLTKQKLTFDVSNLFQQIDTFEFTKDSLIYTKINEEPNYNNLPFGLKIGDSKENVLNLIESIRLNYDINVDNSVLTLKSTIQNNDHSKINIYDSFPVRSILTFSSGKLAEIYQELYIPRQFSEYQFNELIRINNLGPSYFYLKSETSRIQSIKTSLSVLSDNFLSVYKSKYGDENYCIYNIYQEPDITNLSVLKRVMTDFRYLWYKSGVLIDYNINYSNAEKMLKKYTNGITSKINSM